MTAFLPNTVSSMTVQTAWPMQMILPITCSVRWKLLTRTVKLERKADMFTKRTIKPHQAVAAGGYGKRSTGGVHLGKSLRGYGAI